ncbi:signal peptidase [Parapedobacter lycopersici]|uniref:signal peptidase n=1 Tax=Parapedobacter lycopersici TaxID=1864939 RepID=UPI00214D8D7E|nr:signal peptidase [Parapedobacter lycopersici]
MNKYLLRGIGYTVVGLASCAWSYALRSEENALYRWIMIAGVILFGIGFLTIIYSFIRKIERHSILEERREQQEKE